MAKALEQLKAQAQKAGLAVTRAVLAYEAGRDGFWIARALEQCGVEVDVMHPASIPIERRRKRKKTDRIDVDLLLTTLLPYPSADGSLTAGVVRESVSTRLNAA